MDKIILQDLIPLLSKPDSLIRQTTIELALLLCLLTSHIGFAQEPPAGNGEVPIISPTAASLGKFVDVPVNMHTGIPSINIPIYTVTEGSLLN